MSCIFCDIRDGVIPSKKLYEDDRCYVINDIAPIAPTHMLLITKEHLKDVTELATNPELSAHIFSVIKTVAQQQGLDEGFRVITNRGEQGGQSVMHLHFHIVGGKQLGWCAL